LVKGSKGAASVRRKLTKPQKGEFHGNGKRSVLAVTPSFNNNYSNLEMSACDYVAFLSAANAIGILPILQPDCVVRVIHCLAGTTTTKTAFHVAQIFLLLSDPIVSGAPVAVFKVMRSLAEAAASGADSSSARENDSQSEWSSLTTDAPLTRSSSCSSSSSSSSMSPAAHLLASSPVAMIGATAAALEAWLCARKPPSVASADFAALMEIVSMLAEYLATLEDDDAAVRRLGEELSWSERCAIVTVIKKWATKKKGLAKAVQLDDATLRCLLAIDLECLSTADMQHVMALHNCFPLIAATEKGKDQQALQLATSRLLAGMNLRTVVDKRERIWINQWCNSVRPRQLAEPVREAISKISGWNSAK
jgi:hypothetical protein